MKYPLISIVGFRGCGKNFVFETGLLPQKIKNKHFKNYAFADLLKQYCKKIYGFSLKEIEYYKRKPYLFKIGDRKMDMRHILVTTANSLRELSSDTIWADLTIDKINKDLEKENYNFIPVITDLRFLQEYELLKSKFNLFNIYVESDCSGCVKNLNNKDEQEINIIKNYANHSLNLNCFKSKKDTTEIIMKLEKLNIKIFNTFLKKLN